VKNRIVEIRVVSVPSGTEVQALTRSRRGSKYILRSQVVLTAGLEPQEKRSLIAQAASDLINMRG